MIGTDGLKLAVVYLDEDAEELVGRLIRREALERWARSATGKSRLTGDELKDVSRADYALNDGYYEGVIDWKKTIPSIEDKKELDSITFNGEFAKIAQDLFGVLS